MHYIAGYRFVTLTQLETLRSAFLTATEALRGTILLSEEGININLAGDLSAIRAFQAYLQQDERFRDIPFHEMSVATQPYQRLKIKIKKEIITLRQPTVQAAEKRAPAIAPHLLKQWLDEKRDIQLLDTRNDFEVEAGTFRDAIHLQLQNFGELPSNIGNLDQNKPVVMFCTGGIRCEKAALYMQQQGFQDVYQLDGGILGYFAEVGDAHYEGGCFVFDERVAVKPDLTPCH